MNKLAKHITPALVLGMILASCNLGADSNNSILSTDEPASQMTSSEGEFTDDLALNKNVTASSSLANEPAENSVDGDPSTSWGAGSHPEQWIQIDLGFEAEISKIKLTVGQYPEGNTRHIILAGLSDSLLDEIHVLEGFTSDNQVLEFEADPPIVDVRYVRVLTVESPSWVAWKEIEVYGQAVPTPAQAGVTAPSSGKFADVIYYNGQILTMEKTQPTARAIAIEGDTILAVGSNEEAMKFQGSETRLVDLRGLTLTPGFINSHSHRIGDRGMVSGEDISFEELFEGIMQEGWTSIHELFVWDVRMNELIELDRQRRLPIRVSAYLAVGFDYDYNPWYKDAGYKPLQQFSPRLQIGGIKITLDREWGEQIFFTQEQLDRMVLDATQDGWQVAIHSFSPQANEELLNAYEKALNGESNDVLRLRHEHIGVLTDEQLRREARLGIIASVQLIGTSAYADDASFKKYIPEEMWPKTARWRDLINAGVFIIGNVDDPWCCTAWRKGSKDSYGDPTVMQAVYQGMTGVYFTGRQPELWQSAQVVTAQEALEMMTINGAYAAHQENKIGSLRPGKFADIVILSANPLTTPVEQIPRISVVMTMVGGIAKYCSSDQMNVCVSSTTP